MCSLLINMMRVAVSISRHLHETALRVDVDKLRPPVVATYMNCMYLYYEIIKRKRGDTRHITSLITPLSHCLFSQRSDGGMPHSPSARAGGSVLRSVIIPAVFHSLSELIRLGEVKYT